MSKAPVIGNANPGAAAPQPPATVTDALNGLHLDGTVVKLGGALVENTQIDANENTLTINGGLPFDPFQGFLQFAKLPGPNPIFTGLVNIGTLQTGGTNAKMQISINPHASADGFIIYDDIFHNGIFGREDFSANILPTGGSMNSKQYVQRTALVSILAANINKEGQTAAVTCLTFTPTSPETIRINVTGIMASGQAAIQTTFKLSYTDTRGNAHIDVCPGNSVISNVITATQIPPMIIHATANSPVSILTTMSGAMVYDYTVVMEILHLPQIT